MEAAKADMEGAMEEVMEEGGQREEKQVLLRKYK